MPSETNPSVKYILFSPQNEQPTPFKSVFKKIVSDYDCFSCLDDVLFPTQRALPPTVARKLNRIAIILCLLSLLFASILTCLSYISFTESKSCGVFAFAFDALLQVISSITLIWRFSSVTPRITVGRKETIATIAVALCNAASAISILVPTVQILRENAIPTHPKFSMITSGLGLSLYTILFLAKYGVARKLGSSALMTDAMDSLGGALMGFTILVSSIVLMFTTRVWFLDSITAFGIALLMLLYATTVMVGQIRLRKSREDDLNGCWLMIFGLNEDKSSVEDATDW